MSNIGWSKLVTRTVGELTHWSINPRRSDDDTRERLRKSKRTFSQTQPLLIGPDNAIYDGHQRVTAWLEEFGGGLEVEVRVCSRELTEEERKELTIVHHAGAVGEWDFAMLQKWDIDEKLEDWGLPTADMEWAEDIVYENEADVWDGMPEYEQEDISNAHLSLKVHFLNAADRDSFAELISQTITPKTKFVYYPQQRHLKLAEYTVADES